MWSCSHRPTPRPQQRQILSPLSEARDPTCVLTDARRVPSLLIHDGAWRAFTFLCVLPSRPLDPRPEGERGNDVVSPGLTRRTNSFRWDRNGPSPVCKRRRAGVPARPPARRASRPLWSRVVVGSRGLRARGRRAFPTALPHPQTCSSGATTASSAGSSPWASRSTPTTCSRAACTARSWPWTRPSTSAPWPSCYRSPRRTPRCVPPRRRRRRGFPPGAGGGGEGGGGGTRRPGLPPRRAARLAPGTRTPPPLRPRLPVFPGKRESRSEPDEGQRPHWLPGVPCI